MLFPVVDVFRLGYSLGYEHGQQGQRRRALWELRLTRLILWVPFVDNASYDHGYHTGYEDGLRMRTYGETNPLWLNR